MENSSEIEKILIELREGRKATDARIDALEKSTDAYRSETRAHIDALEKSTDAKIEATKAEIAAIKIVTQPWFMILFALIGGVISFLIQFLSH